MEEHCCKGPQEMERKCDSIVINVDGQDGIKDGKKDSNSLHDSAAEVVAEGFPAVLDFDLLCATVAMQNNHMSFEVRSLLDRESAGGGVQRMWEGGLMECHDERDVCLRTAFLPFITFGKNMGMAGFGSSICQGIVHFVLCVCALIFFIIFGVTRTYSLLYVAIALMLLMAAYAGYFRSQMRARFNIKGSDGPIDDCLHHLFCSMCALCQEARTLEINNVQDGVWHGRGDILVRGFRDLQKGTVELQEPSVLTVSPEPCQMEGREHSWIKVSDQAEPLVGFKHGDI